MDNYSKELELWIKTVGCFIAVFFFAVGLSASAVVIGVFQLFNTGGL